VRGGLTGNGLLVAQATRRTERERQFEPIGTAFSRYCSPQFRSAGRRPGRAGRPSTLRSKQALAPVASERATEDGRHPFFKTGCNSDGGVGSSLYRVPSGDGGECVAGDGVKAFVGRGMLVLSKDVHSSYNGGRAWIVLFMTHTRIDGLMAGTALAWWWHYKRTEGQTEQLKKHGHWLILVGITLLLSAFIGNVAKNGWLTGPGSRRNTKRTGRLQCIHSRQEPGNRNAPLIMLS